MSKDLLFEIGTEEIPAGFVPSALESMRERLARRLDKERLAFESVRTLGTPRRLVLIVKALSEKQPDAEIEVRGPSRKAAFDPGGAPTKTLEGFARSQGVDPKDVRVRETDKGEYVFAVKKIKGERTGKILPGVLSDLVVGDYFPKSMRWGDYDVSFARPVHWILALYGEEPVGFGFGHVRSSTVTYGHRFLGGDGGRKKAIKVAGVDGYLEALSSAYVIPDPEQRKGLIRDGIGKAAEEAGGRVVPDPGLVQEVTYLVEYPVVVTGSFDREFLALPRDVVVNAMREHQRYFSVEDETGALLPYFITVANTRAVDMAVVAKGNERVLKARLNDAKFYFEQDVKVPLSNYVERLKGVIFQKKLGTSYEKVERLTALALHIGAEAGFSAPLEEGEVPADFLTPGFNPSSFDPGKLDPALYSKYVLGRSAILAKADLVTGMVGEFPKLQGLMGGEYARRGGEVPEVAVAIVEHYLPLASGGGLPASMPGALVSMADKLDTITGCFAVGLVPSGAQDPYALRRAALGIIAIMLDKGLGVPLDGLVDKALDLLAPRLSRERREVRAEVLEFFKERLRNQLRAQGLSFDSIDSVLATRWFALPDAVERIKAIEAFKEDPSCTDLVVSFKRVSNILKGFGGGAVPDPALFTEPQERELFDASSRLAPVINELWGRGDYRAVFTTLASIKDTIDSFFDHVMVMAEDERTRQNRLSLVNSVRDLYFKIADLSRLLV